MRILTRNNLLFLGLGIVFFLQNPNLGASLLPEESLLIMKGFQEGKAYELYCTRNYYPSKDHVKALNSKNEGYKKIIKTNPDLSAKEREELERKIQGNEILASSRTTQYKYIFYFINSHEYRIDRYYSRANGTERIWVLDAKLYSSKNGSLYLIDIVSRRVFISDNYDDVITMFSAGMPVLYVLRDKYYDSKKAPHWFDVGVQKGENYSLVLKVKLDTETIRELKLYLNGTVKFTETTHSGIKEHDGEFEAPKLLREEFNPKEILHMEMPQDFRIDIEKDGVETKDINPFQVK